MALTLLFVCVLNGFAGALIIILSPKDSNNVQGPNISIHKEVLKLKQGRRFSPQLKQNLKKPAMAVSMKNVDPAFQGVGQKTGMEIWRVESLHLISVPKSEHGKFYSRDCYIVLQTSSTISGSRHYDIHFWIGNDTSEDEAGAASIKSIELDAALGGRTVQYRELHGHETDKFLSYFKPCFIPLEGYMASGDTRTDTTKLQPSLYLCKGRRVVHVKQVPFSRSSLNHDDVFVLDTESKIYQFNGATSNIQERAKALDVVQYIKDKYHEGKCDVAVIEDGKLGSEVDSGEFWAFFGGFAPIGKKSNNEDDLQLEPIPGKLYIVIDGELKNIEGSLSKGMLESNKCYLLDCGSEIYIWVGRVTQLEDRKAASLAAEEFISSQKRPKYTHIVRVIQGFETLSFKANFETWPHGPGTAGSEEGKGKVASLIKKQGVDMKGILKATPGKDEAPPLLEENGKLEVWLVNNNTKVPVPTEEVGKFYSQDCYIILYTYHTGGDRKEDYFLCLWLGQQSTQENKTTAAQLMNSIAVSLKGRPVQGRLVQGKEPAQFIALFPNLAILNGKMNIGKIKDNVENDSMDETNMGDCVALFKVCGTDRHNCKAIQVDPVAASLDSTCCFLLQTGTSLLIWHGNSTTVEQQKSAATFAEFLRPAISLKAVKEGTEPATFWNVLGEKQSYVSQRGAQESGGDPHLYACAFEKGILKPTEVFNFTQDDLLTEDIMVLDTHSEVFVWIGQHANSKLKQQSFDIGQKYTERAAVFEGLSLDTPLYIVTEGNEPSFFTRYFAWDSSKAVVQGNSFEKKLVILRGKPILAVEKLKGRVHNINAASSENTKQTPESLNGLRKGGLTRKSSALAALTSAFTSSNGEKGSSKDVKASSKPALNQSSRRSSVGSALSTALSVEIKSHSAKDLTVQSIPVTDAVTVSDATKIETNNTTDAESELPKQDESASENDTKLEVSMPDNKGEEISKDVNIEPEENGSCTTYSYERLISNSTNPARGIDPRRRESYLTAEDFYKIFNMDQKHFYEQPKWKQQRQKKAVDLF